MCVTVKKLDYHPRHCGENGLGKNKTERLNTPIQKDEVEPRGLRILTW